MIPLKDVNPTERFPVFTVSIIIICTLIFIREISMPQIQLEQFVRDYGLVPSVLFNENIPLLYRLSRIFTSMFLHGSFAHLIGNMLYLWIFGNNIEDRLGHLRFLIFYLLCGIAAGLAQASAFPDSSTPMIGASGAIAGVLGGYLIMFPGARIITLVIIFYYITLQEIPAFIVIGIWFLLQFMSSLGSLAGIQTGVAYIAHVGGFIAGLVLIMLFPKRKRHYRYLPDDYDF
jgi:membrane associated rhomboid family serine protease